MSCNGCSVESVCKFFTCEIKRTSTPVDVLLVSPFYSPQSIYPESFSPNAENRLKKLLDILGVTYEFTSAVKCPLEEISNADANICRQYILEDIEYYNPKLVIAFGNPSLKLILKKSGITKKRGRVFNVDINKTKFSVLASLDIEKYFTQTSVILCDIRMAIEMYVLKSKVSTQIDFEVVENISLLREYVTKFINGADKVAVDLETEGFNFLSDKVLTISIAHPKVGTIVVPIQHKDSPFSEEEIPQVSSELSRLFEYDLIPKIFHNAKFDLKFLKSIGIKTNNIEDTAVMAHLVDENKPNNLFDLIKRHLPEYIDDIEAKLDLSC